MKFCVIGLGRLGRRVATGLTENGMEVLAIDSDESIVASIRDEVTQAVCMRVTDDESLRSIGIEEISTVIVATGENFSQSILITALLKKMKVPRVIARAVNSIHKDILTLLGADRIILPEQEVGTRLADTLSYPFTDFVRLATNFSISQMVAPQKFVGKTPRELNLFEKYNVNFIGIKEDETKVTRDLDYTIAEDDKIIFSGENKYLEKIAKL
ncbi:TrkA family potassium uptake protein [bacterium]|nr:TrkA family potassium uptake protein [bacterium]